jgi:transglutaminase-like putative cysteine protease
MGQHKHHNSQVVGDPGGAGAANGKKLSMHTTATSRNGRSTAPTNAAPWLRLLPEDGWLTLALLVVLVYTTIASIQGAGWGVAGLDILTWTTGAGLLLGYLAVQQGRLPGTLIHLLALALGVGYTFKETADAVAGGDWRALWDHVKIWLNQAIVQHGTSDDNIVFLLCLSILSFFLAYISVWLVLHTRRPWLAALANGVVLLLNLNGTVDNRALFFLLIFLLATLLLLMRFTLAENVRQWQTRGLRFAPDLGWDFMQAGALFAITVLLLAYLLPSGNGTALLLGNWNSPNNPWQAVQITWSKLFPVPNTKAPPECGVLGCTSRLTLHGTVNLPGDTVLRYTVPRTTDDPPQYLMTETFDTYDGTSSWFSQPTQTTEYTASGIESTSPGVDPGAVTTDTYDIVFESAQEGNQLFSPGSEPKSFSVAADAYLSAISSVPIKWAAQSQVVAGHHYVSVGYVSTATADQLRRVPFPQDAKSAQGGSVYPAGVLREYLTADEVLSKDVVQAALTVTRGSTTMYDAALDLEDYLQTFTYSTNNPEPPAGQDATAWFLRVKKGYCTFFASAMALMGRALGMPTRVVRGFTNGAYDAKTNTWVVTGKDEHAWTQIYFGQYGWINFEPTSSFKLFGSGQQGGGPPVVTATGGTVGSRTPTPNGQVGTPSPVPTPGTNLSSSASTALVGVGLGLSLLIVLILLVAAFFAVWWRLLYRGLSPVTEAFARTLRLGRWAGASPKRSQTPDEYAEQLAGVISGQRHSLRRLSELYAIERWGGGLEQDTAAEVLRLYEQVQTSTVVVITRRARHLPVTLLRATGRARGIQRLLDRDD